MAEGAKLEVLTQALCVRTMCVRTMCVSTMCVMCVRTILWTGSRLTNEHPYPE